MISIAKRAQGGIIDEIRKDKCAASFTYNLENDQQIYNRNLREIRLSGKWIFDGEIYVFTAALQAEFLDFSRRIV
jgi:hypothetical protein